ncbi:MAG: hypothetical protein HGB11_10530 [Chlorobiales bacterium]|nr:hypothetical protein [Chlorobiales bacterium]
MSQTSNIGVQFVAFQFLRFSFEQPVDLQKSELFWFNVGADIRGESNQVFVQVNVLVRRENEGGNILASATTESVFTLQGMDEGPQPITDINQLNSAVVVTLISLAISTTRGALLTKGAGSFLEQVPMPIIDPKSLLQQPKNSSI